MSLNSGSIENTESITSLLMMGVFEAAVNAMLSQHEQAARTLARHVGKVIRIKVYNPHICIYLILCENGVQLLSHFEGVVDARIRVPASQFISLVLGETTDPQRLLTQLKATGNHQLIIDLMQLATDMNVWRWIIAHLKNWLPDYREIFKSLVLLPAQTEEWGNHLQQISGLAHEALHEIRRQNQAQTALLQELVQMRQWMREQDKTAVAQPYWIALVLMALLVLGILFFK